MQKNKDCLRIDSASSHKRLFLRRIELRFLLRNGMGTRDVVGYRLRRTRADWREPSEFPTTGDHRSGRHPNRDATGTQMPTPAPAMHEKPHIGGASTNVSDQESDKIFVRSRPVSDDPGLDSALVMREFHTYSSNGEILREVDIDKAKSRFIHLHNLEKKFYNAYITKAYNAPVFHPAVSLYEKMCFSIKAILGIKRNTRAIKDTIYPETDLKREYLLQKSAADIKEAFAVACKTPEERLAFVGELLSEIDDERLVSAWSRGTSRPLHERPLWQGKRGENPIPFIKATYGDLLFGEDGSLKADALERSAIANHDPRLGQAYANWLKRNPKTEIIWPRRTGETAGMTSAQRQRYIKAMGKAAAARQLAAN